MALSKVDQGFEENRVKKKIQLFLKTQWLPEQGGNTTTEPEMSQFFTALPRSALLHAIATFHGLQMFQKAKKMFEK